MGFYVRNIWQLLVSVCAIRGDEYELRYRITSHHITFPFLFSVFFLIRLHIWGEIGRMTIVECTRHDNSDVAQCAHRARTPTPTTDCLRAFDI